MPAKYASVSILTYVHSGGLHFIAIEYDEETGLFYKYNVGRWDTAPLEKPSVDSWLVDGGYTALTIITISKEDDYEIPDSDIYPYVDRPYDIV